ncbi:sulfite exporter TauE/SafE family protein [Marinobacter fonticola]|uniref:sulfite exporter TauE/SafE family protein n=1 Tax=Marinobacter fonticola TaxID=2603215 RepID=UPI0011E60EE3|nr:sulfite exporter TauE/SafE family protein [Marinobacter fonticola]
MDWLFLSAVLPATLDPALAIILLVASAITSLITASLGAGGGALLLVLMALWLPPAAIIPVHGLIQLGSNGGRAALTLRYVDWRVLAIFLPGVVLGAVLGAAVLVSLPPAIWQLTIALFILYLCWGPSLPKAILSPIGVFLAALGTTFLTLFVGATGPLVAAFIKQIHQDRFRTVSTFACAMVLQHGAKAVVFGFAGFALGQWLPFIAAMIVCGFVGTWLGLHVLRRLSNRRFQQFFNVLLTLLALRLIWQAAEMSGWMG